MTGTYFCTYNKKVEITWDPEKAAGNPKKHQGVTFEEAKNVLLDPFALVREDEDAEEEQRFVALGTGAKGRILVVVYTYRHSADRGLEGQ